MSLVRCAGAATRSDGRGGLADGSTGRGEGLDGRCSGSFGGCGVHGASVENVIVTYYFGREREKRKERSTDLAGGTNDNNATYNYRMYLSLSK